MNKHEFLIFIEKKRVFKNWILEKPRDYWNFSMKMVNIVIIFERDIYHCDTFGDKCHMV